MRLLPVTALLLVPAAFAADTTLSQGDRDFALSTLHSTRKLFLDSVAGLTGAQWDFKPAPGRWSIAECAEHIALSEEFISGMLKKGLETPVTPEKRFPPAEARAKDERMIAMTIDRSHKAEAPEPIRPSHHFKSPQEALVRFRAARQANIEYMIQTQDDLRDRLMENPVYGQFDLYQGYLMLAAHSQRHTLQILEVKEAAGYPRAQLEQADREFALSSLHATRKLFLDSVEGLTPAQWNFKAGPDRWSIAECAEHIALSEDVISQAIKKAAKGPLRPELRMPAAAARVKDQKLLEGVVDRSHKYQAPESIRPSHRFATPQEAVASFRQSRDQNVEYIGTTTDDLRAVAMRHPVAGEMDGLQFMLLLSAHSERHTRQILEVKADPNYPR
jgi:hypothetical protein